MIVLNEFNHGDSFTLAELESKTHLPEIILKSAIQQLSAVSSGPLLLTDSTFSTIRVNETPSWSGNRLNLVPPVVLEVQSSSVPAVLREDRSVQVIQVEAAIVKVMKKEKFVALEDLPKRILSYLKYSPEVGMEMGIENVERTAAASGGCAAEQGTDRARREGSECVALCCQLKCLRKKTISEWERKRERIV